MGSLVGSFAQFVNISLTGACITGKLRFLLEEDKEI